MLESVPVPRRGYLLAIPAVFLQFLLELVLGRLLVAPNLLCIVLVYLLLNRGLYWSVEGAFWCGLVLDCLLHQPLGSSSLALIIGLQSGRLILASLSSESRAVFFLTVGVVSLVSDTSAILLASRPFLSHFSWSWLIVVPRSLATVVVAAAWAFVAGGFESRRRASRTL